MALKHISYNSCVLIIGAIIRQSIEDLSDPSEKIRNAAREYFYNDDFDFYCISFGVLPEYIRRQIEISNNVQILPILNEFEKALDHKCESLPRGTLKRLSEKDLKKYRSTYRKNRAKQLTLQRTNKYCP